MPDTQYFRTVVAYEVLTQGEAFGGEADDLRDADSVTMLDRQEPEEISAQVYQRLVDLHDVARGDGYDITRTVLVDGA